MQVEFAYESQCDPYDTKVMPLFLHPLNDGTGNVMYRSVRLLMLPPTLTYVELTNALRRFMLNATLV